MSFLMGLNDSHAQIRGQLLLLDPLPPINKVFSLVIQEERQRNVSSLTNSGGADSINGLAFAFRNDNSKRSTYDNNSSGNNKNQKKERPFCTHCNFHGHTPDRCYKLHGYPPGYKQKQRPQNVSIANAIVNQLSDQSSPCNSSEQAHGQLGHFLKTLSDTQYQQLMTMLSTHLVSSNKAIESPEDPSSSLTAGYSYSITLNPQFNSTSHWIMDSGVSKHTYSNANMFTSLKHIKHSTVILPNNDRLSVSPCGDIQLSPHLILRDVLFVPQFQLNLIFVNAFTTDCPLIVHFFHDHFTLQDNSTKMMIGMGGRINDMYILNPNNLEATNSHHPKPVSALVNKVSANLWNARLGHLSFKCLDLLKSQLAFTSTKCTFMDPCYICTLSKQRRLSFISNNHMSKFPFNLIHCAIWGPYHISANSGYRYFLTLVDDCTGFAWVFLLRHKSDVQTAIPKFFNMIETQFHSKSKVFRSENARDLVFTNFFNDKGVLHQYSCVDTPQQNSIVERKHQHLLNVARALYFQSKIPTHFWTECILIATFLINCTPPPLLGNKTPYELLYKHIPDSFS